MDSLCEATLIFMDDVNELGEDEKDIIIVNKVSVLLRQHLGLFLTKNEKGSSSVLGGELAKVLGSPTP
jgi:hypothetical protein